MPPRDNVWIAQRGYTPLTGCEIKGNVVSIAQWGSGGAPKKHIWVHPPNILLTEEARGLMQEDGGYSLLDI